MKKRKVKFNAINFHSYVFYSNDDEFVCYNVELDHEVKGENVMDCKFKMIEFINNYLIESKDSYYKFNWNLMEYMVFLYHVLCNPECSMTNSYNTSMIEYLKKEYDENN